ncbi:MAG: hypothetical protein ACI81V_000093 [Lentimonas sp.]|jgi:hypothetical protein
MNGLMIVQVLKKYPIAVIASCILFVLLGLLFLRGGIVPRLEQIESELSQTLRVFDTNERNAQGLPADLEALNLQVAKIPKFLFVPSERALNTNFFYTFEDQVDIVITDIKQVSDTDPVLSKGGPHALQLYSVLVYDISVGVDFYGFLKLLHAIHGADHVMRVSEFQLKENNSPQVGADSLSARIRVVVLAKQE